MPAFGPCFPNTLYIDDEQSLGRDDRSTRAAYSCGERERRKNPRHVYVADCTCSEWLALKSTTFRTVDAFYCLSLSPKPNSHCVTWAATKALLPCVLLFCYILSDIDMHSNARGARYRTEKLSYPSPPPPSLFLIVAIPCDDCWPTTLDYAMYM